MNTDATMLVSAVGARAPASGCVGFSSTLGGSDAQFSSAPALGTLPHSKSLKAPASSRATNGVETMQMEWKKQMVKEQRLAVLPISEQSST